VKADAIAAVAAASQAAALHAAAKADAHLIKGKAAEAKLVEKADAKEAKAQAKAAVGAAEEAEAEAEEEEAAEEAEAAPRAAQPRPSAAELAALAALDPRRAPRQPTPKGAKPAEYTLMSAEALAAIDIGRKLPRPEIEKPAKEVAEAEAADPDLHWSLGPVWRAAACALAGLAGVAAWRATTLSRRARALEGGAARGAGRAEWEVAETIYKPM